MKIPYEPIPSEWVSRLARHRHKGARQLARTLEVYERHDAYNRSALRPILLRQVDELAAELGGERG